jgi:hypothetical protein
MVLGDIARILLCSCHGYWYCRSFDVPRNKVRIGERSQVLMNARSIVRELVQSVVDAELVEVDLDKVPFHRAIKLIRKKHPPDHAASIIGRMQNGASYDDAVYAVKKYGSGRKNPRSA